MVLNVTWKGQRKQTKQTQITADNANNEQSPKQLKINNGSPLIESQLDDFQLVSMPKASD